MKFGKERKEDESVEEDTLVTVTGPPEKGKRRTPVTGTQNQKGEGRLIEMHKKGSNNGS